MKKIRTLIVDDEPLARNGMADYVAQVDFLQVAATAEDALEALNVISQQPIDLILLDVNMPKLSGIDFLKMLDDPPLVILTTAYPSFALEGYQLNVLDYLVKPVTFPRFLAAAIKAKKQFELLNQTPTTSEQVNTASHFFIKCNGRVEKIYLSELLFVESMQNYVQIHTERGKFTTLLTLKSVLAELPEPRFMQVHKSFIANLEKVQTIDGSQLLIAEHRIPMSRSKAGEVSEIILKGKLLG